MLQIFFLPLKLSSQNLNLSGQQDEKQKVISHSHQQKNPQRFNFNETISMGIA